MYSKKVKKNAEKPLKHEILVIARNMLLRDGYQNLSMRRIAAAAGYSPTTLYNYFKNRDDIIFNLCDEVYAQISDIIAGAMDAALSPEQNLKKCMLAYADFGMKHADSYRIAFMTPVEGTNVLSFLEKGAHGMVAYDHILGLASQITDDADTAAQSAWCLMHGIVTQMLMHPHFPWTQSDALIGFAADTFIDGLTRGKK